MPKKGAPLSPREKQVAIRLTTGLTTREIAEELGLSYDTVKLHLARIRRKLGVQRSTQVAVWAARNLLKGRR